MADPAPKTRNWRALENAHKPKGLHVLVFGQVEVSATNKEPVLTETPERNPKNLGLNLTVRTSSGAGAQMMVWKPAHFHKVVKANQYENVIVRWNVDQIANFPIHDDREYAGKAAAAMKALNEQHAGKGTAAKPYGKKPAAKKPAAKKAAAKKAAPTKKSAAKKKAAGPVKSKKAKKAMKKVAKKAAKKKTAKKSAFKKMMGRLVKKFTPAKKKKRR
jgi:MetJ family transcriptional regulator, methionine regulon repressor